MNIHVNYDETDVYKLVDSIISHSNRDYVRLIAELIAQDSKAVEFAFKLAIGNKLPEIIPNDTLVKVNTNHIYVDYRLKIQQQNLADQNGIAIGKIKCYNGCTKWQEYDVTIGDDSYSFQAKHIEIMEEF